MTKYILEVDNLQVSYGETPVLDGVSFTLLPGERLAIVGESGSGKSTTVSAVLNLLPGSGRVTGGNIRFRGEDITNANDSTMRPLRGTKIALIPQDPMSSLNPTMRVGNQIADTLRAHGETDKNHIERTVVRLMEESGIPDAEKKRHQYPHEFSGGMRQRILIAIALAGKPDLIIADEPTSALDVTVQKQILDHLETLVEERGTSLLFITHDLGVASDRTDTVLVMKNGRVIERGNPESVLQAPQETYTQSLVAAAPTLKTAREVTREGSDSVDEAARPAMVSVENLSKIYKLRARREEIKAVDDVSFSVPEGEMTAVIGESGSGKSTIAKILLGLEKASSGQVQIAGHSLDSKNRTERKLIRRLTQPVFQDPYSSLNPTWSIGAIIAEPLRTFRIGDRNSRIRRVHELLDHVALPKTSADKYPSELSGGQRQRVAIARALASSPDLLVCDEAVSALDVLVQEQIMELLKNLQKELGQTSLFITHDLSVVSNYAESTVVLRRGQIVEQGPTDNLISSPESDYTKSLLDAVPGQRYVA